MENMVNKVKIYDDKNNYLSCVSNSAEVNDYGLIQDNYTKETDKDSHTVATGMLTGIEQDVTIPALGNWDCRTGYAVNTEIVYVSNLQKSVMFIEGRHPDLGARNREVHDEPKPELQKPYGQQGVILSRTHTAN